MTHILLGSGRALVLEALEMFLQKLGSATTVTKASTWGDVLASLETAPEPDLVVLDVRTPGMRGLEGLDAMKARLPGRPTVLMSGHDDGGLAREALNRGAAGFITRDMTSETVLRALELVLTGGVYSPMLALPQQQRGDHVETSSSDPPGPANPLDVLTSRQLEVLDLVVQGLTNKTIARSLAIKEATVAFHIKSIFDKLRVSTRTGAAHIALHMGICQSATARERPTPTEETPPERGSTRPRRP